MEDEIIKLKKGFNRILIISQDVIGQQMAGPGIRFYEFAKIISAHADVILATPNRVDIGLLEGIKNITYEIKNTRTLKRYLDVADAILIQGHLLHYFPFLKNYKGKIIVDLYNPFNLESLEMFKNDKIVERLRIDRSNVDLLKFQVAIGDFFICASEKQRSFWLGMLNAMGRVNPYSYDDDNTLKKLIDVVPFGIPSTPPKHTGESIRKIMPGIKDEDMIVLWGGGIWNWLDPITVIKAIWEIARNRKDIKLVFTGIKHPDPKLPEMKKCVDAINLSKELDLYEKFVFFNEWVPYEMRQNFLLESSAGLSIHQDKLETEFSYRTRVMDYIWAKLPIITSEGDSIAKIVKEENIGEVVKFENTHQLARVIESILINRSLKDIYRRNIEKLIPQFYWENVSKPLVEYCIQPQYAADKKKIIELVNIQNSKITNVIKTNLSGATNILVLTSNIFRDREMLEEQDLGKLFFVEVEDNIEKSDKEFGMFDKVGFLKTKILSRTRFDGVIINNTFSRLPPKFFYDLVNVIGMKLRSDGILFFSLPEDRGLLKLFSGEDSRGRSGDRIDEFTVEYILKNTGYEVLSKGDWDRLETDEISPGMLSENQALIDEIYGRNELMELFEIKLSREDFKDLSLLKGLNILDSEAFTADKTVKGKIKRYLYAVTSLYMENLRRSFNISIQAVNNNIQIQINREINQLNAKNRERMIFIYYNIFRTLQFQIANLGVDVKTLKKLLEDRLDKFEKQNTEIDERLQTLLGDIENIDRIMGLTLSNKYFIAKKL